MCWVIITGGVVHAMRPNGSQQSTSVLGLGNTIHLDVACTAAAECNNSLIRESPSCQPEAVAAWRHHQLDGMHTKLPQIDLAPWAVQEGTVEGKQHTRKISETLAVFAGKVVHVWSWRTCIPKSVAEPGIKLQDSGRELHGSLSQVSSDPSTCFLLSDNGWLHRKRAMQYSLRHAPLQASSPKNVACFS